MIDSGLYPTFTAQWFINGFHLRPLSPPCLGYRMHSLPDGREVYVDPNLPETIDRWIVSIVSGYEVPEFLLSESVI